MSTPPVWARLASERAMLSGLDIDRTGEPVILRGRPGFARIAAGYRVVNEMVVGPDPYVGWFGRR